MVVSTQRRTLKTLSKRSASHVLLGMPQLDRNLTARIVTNVRQENMARMRACQLASPWQVRPQQAMRVQQLAKFADRAMPPSSRVDAQVVLQGPTPRTLTVRLAPNVSWDRTQILRETGDPFYSKQADIGHPPLPPP